MDTYKQDLLFKSALKESKEKNWHKDSSLKINKDIERLNYKMKPDLMS
jgi:hypothetical protein